MDERRFYFVSILITFTLVFLPQGDAIRCYECSSFPGSGCGEDFRLNHVNLVDCDTKVNPYDTYNRPVMCKKKITKTSDGIVIHRGCLMRKELEELNSDEMCAPMPYNNQDIVCRCDTDRCNGAISQRLAINLCFVSFLSFVLPFLMAVNYF